MLLRLVQPYAVALLRSRATTVTLRLSIMVPISINQLSYRYYKYRRMFN